ncbi:hypothetical protein JCM3263A_21080 [Thermobifida fusca]|nr:DUF1707 and DUF4870 domain-containing protein [Thermobifida fusca]
MAVSNPTPPIPSYGGRPVPPSQMRVTHAERDRIAEMLRDAYAEGQLDEEELDERLSRAMKAKTRGDLQPLVADLSLTPASAAVPHPVQQGEPTKEERLWAAGGHLSGYFLPVLGPLIVMLVKNGSPYARTQAIRALNYHLNLLIATVLAPFAIFLLVTIPIYLFLFLGWVFLPLVGGVASLIGSNWKYPLTIDIVKEHPRPPETPPLQ